MPTQEFNHQGVCQLPRHPKAKQPVKQDLAELGIPVDLESKSKGCFKNTVKNKARKFAFFKFLDKKESH